MPRTALKLSCAVCLSITLNSNAQTDVDNPVPLALEEVERGLTYLKSVSAFMAWLDLEEKSFRLAVRAITPYGQR